MKIMHTADLHIGKKLFEHSLMEDQKYILGQMTELAISEQVDAVVIAGDVYDRPIPSTEAVEALDAFLTGLIQKGIQVFLISGNHDSPERVAFAEQILEKQGLYIAGNYEGGLKQVVLEDEHGPIHFVLMPFVKPAVTGCGTLSEAVEEMLGHCPMTFDLGRRYVLVAHYFVTGEGGELPELSDFETDVNVGGLDSVPAAYFRGFCYTALGHLHRPQQVGRGQVYYAGSPLKYSFSEANTDKSVNIVELGRFEVSVRRVPLKPMRELRCVKGRLSELISEEVRALQGEGREDYLQVTLTDTEELIDPMSTLRSVYPNVLNLQFQRREQETGRVSEGGLSLERKEIGQLFGEFYELLRGEPLDENRQEIVREAARLAKAEPEEEPG
ncbi:MAG: exonuclease SbcCD subunit D [Roseburia sp.]|nr:exonuclease SbcCD subunit D [Roseburia sp.]